MLPKENKRYIQYKENLYRFAKNQKAWSLD